MRLSEVINRLEALQRELLLNAPFPAPGDASDPEIVIDYRWGNPAQGTRRVTGIHQIRSVNHQLVLTPEGDIQ